MYTSDLRRSFACCCTEWRNAKVAHGKLRERTKGPTVVKLELDVGLNCVGMLECGLKVSSGERDSAVSRETDICAVFDDLQEGVDERAIRVVAKVEIPIMYIKCA